jgi:ADP-heptose:LPS heptosyltransferase
MPRRERWRNRRGTESRVQERGERFLTGLGSTAAKALSALGVPRALAGRRDGDPSAPRVLALRLDRIGDVVMTLPALADLRAALPRAHITFAVGRWSEAVARRAPVDEILLWSAPWVGRRDEGASSLGALVLAARASGGFDLALDFQGDLRAIWLMTLAGATERAGYANTGSGSLLSRVAPLDEGVNWVEQNRRLVAVALGRAVERQAFSLASVDATSRGRAWLVSEFAASGRPGDSPIIGLHPGAGRTIKEWPVSRWRDLSARLARERDARLAITGSLGEAHLTAEIARAVPGSLDLAGRIKIDRFIDVLSGFDAFVTGDTAAVHLAAAMDVPTVAIFGPSDPVRYFSGGPEGFGGGAPKVALAAEELWCRPCNLIRRPPEECVAAETPECLRGVDVDRVFRATVSALGRDN